MEKQIEFYSNEPLDEIASEKLAKIGAFTIVACDCERRKKCEQENKCLSEIDIMLRLHGGELPTFGERLRHLRIAQRMNRFDLAAKIKLADETQISRYESNKSIPSKEKLVLIANALDADLHWLITGELSPSEKELADQAYRKCRKLRLTVSEVENETGN